MVGGGQWIKKKRTNLKIITCDVNCKIKANKCAKLFMETLKLLLLLLLLLLFAFSPHRVVALRKKYFNGNIFLWSAKERSRRSGQARKIFMLSCAICCKWKCLLNQVSFYLKFICLVFACFQKEGWCHSFLWLVYQK